MCFVQEKGVYISLTQFADPRIKIHYIRYCLVWEKWYFHTQVVQAKWFSSHPSNIEQRVEIYINTIRGTSLVWKSTKHGAPQRSVSWPLLFNLTLQWRLDSILTPHFLLKIPVSLFLKLITMICNKCQLTFVSYISMVWC